MRHKLLSQGFIFFLLLLTILDIQELYYLQTLSLGSPRPMFPQIQIELLNSHNEALRKDALQETATRLVRYVCPEFLHESRQAYALCLNLLPGPDIEVIIGITIAQHKGLLCILQKQQGPYLPVTCLNNLQPLTGLNALTLPAEKVLLITTEETLQTSDESTYKKSRLTYWSWQAGKLQSVWSENPYWEECRLNHEKPSLQPQWQKIIQENSIVYHPSPQPRLQVTTNQAYYRSENRQKSVPPQEVFTRISSSTKTQDYTWNETWQRFVLHTGQLSLPQQVPQAIAILKSIEGPPDELLEGLSPLYQVIDRNGQLFFVEQHWVQLDSS